MFNLKQAYEEYTAEQFEVWRLLYEQQIENYKGRAAQAVLDGLQKVNFVAYEIPHFENTNAILQATTGWQLEVVPGLIPDKEFFMLMSERKFPATTWLRKLSELEYLEEPDMFHDVFAHVPLLTNQYFVDFLQSISKIALEHIDNPLAIELIGRVYWFTIEFGLIQETEGVRIYGAGILSSTGETKFCLSEAANQLKYDVKSIMELHYYKDDYQDRYYVIESYEQLFNSVQEIRKWLGIALSKYPKAGRNVSNLDISLS